VTSQRIDDSSGVLVVKTGSSQSISEFLFLSLRIFVDLRLLLGQLRFCLVIGRLNIQALNIFILSSHFLSSRCGHPYVPGHIEAQVEPGSPERAVCSMFLEHGEWWDEHLVDDVHDAVVGDHVRREHMPTIDRDAFSHSGGYRV